MADINLERKERSVWPWILGILLLAALIWGATELFDSGAEVAETETDMVTEPTVEMPATTPTPEATTTAALPISQILASPTTYTTPVNGQARVAEVVSTSAFWLEEGGNRILTIVDQPLATPLSAGQMVQIENGRVYGTANMTQMPAQLDAETQSLVQGQQAVLYVQSADVAVLNTTAGQSM